ncbi:rho guanine nucleotide exchange factor 18 isoform X3 [Schistocerca gregaria]|uniref:rho guanine nucleotide exchange factor 18 isoform X3 n=1 Tax=Schistocerca gregaria TaxID=7010 RepID=UPI00211E9674|nr:rho guanine nucleotide exchange factor 18 isoform X3 [Schistocerca gregaria]XP_049832575.1 rho guanine nucleotide exchange factor 18 isoform X3 [Schistocerca gregaria]
MERLIDSHMCPLSSDECPDDSDEDVITDYLSEDQPSVESNSGAPMAVNKHEVPTISVTPHSPGTKVYPVLEDNLQHLHEIHENVQQMRDLNTQAIHAIHAQILGLTQYSRLSASCPSLNNEGASDLDVEASLNSSPTQPTPLGSSVNPCFPETLQTKAPKDWLMCRDGSGDVPRRRSWTALEDLTGGRAKRKSERQRSMSLSSLDSEPDDPFLDRVDGAGSTGLLLSETASLGGGGTGSAGSGGRRSARGSGGASTHSLNEADLQNDFNKLAAKREMDNLRLLPIRLPLQKSVSTPSILAVRDMVGEAVTDSTPAIPAGTESETEEELMPSGKHLVTPHINIALDEFLTDAAYDHRSGKRRKRGSIFFRKKKDKTKKVPHQWVSACYGSAHACDWCSKPVTNKPALYCENCMTTVHQNSCKDQIQDCSKPKISKNSGKGTAFPAVMSTSKLSGNKRGSSSTQSQNHHSSSSSSQIINEEREGDYGQHDGLGYYDDVPLVQFEFLDEGPITASDLETDPFLGLQDDEPDSWTPTVGKEVAKKLKEKEVKRQEHIYEFILTEKHHCLTLRVMQKVFVEGFQKHFQLGNDLERMFPCLSELTEIHLNFLQRLRQRQKEEPVVVTISDILLEQFSGVCAEKLKSAYGEFCSRHRDAVNIYKNYLHDRRFAEFVKHCQVNPLLKKKGIPECILFVTQRLTKYPLLIEPLIKTAKDNKVEQENLTKALALVKEILVEVDAQVAEKEKEDRKLEIYNKIEAKSFTIYRGNKFKKSDILLENRKLRFEGVSTLMQGRSKMQVVLVIVLSDVLFFLLENNNKYSFFTPDNKAGVVSLQKLLVREKAGQDSRGIYLISSNPSEPEMFELKVHKPKDKQVWIRAIRSAVENCQEDEDEGIVLSLEEKQKLMEAKQLQIRQIVGSCVGVEGMLRQKDLEQAQILEEKMALQQKLLAAAGVENILNPPNYTSLMSEDTDSSVIWQEVKSAVHEVNQLANSLCASGTNLSRSVSSVGEHQSEAYISPTLPKRAETFGGFDNANKEQLPMAITKGVVRKLQQRESRDHSNYSTPVMTPDSESSPSSKQETMSPKVSHDQPPWRSAVMATIPPVVLPSNVCENSCEVPALSSLAQDQQTVAVQLSHYFYKLLSIIHHQMTTINSLQAQLSACKVQLTQDDAKDRRPVYKHNQQLEELRNLQDRLTQEKEAWQREKEAEEKELDEKKQELLRLQEQVRAESEDVRQQREKLYSKLEYLTSQGILISPNMPVVTAVPPEDSLSGQGILIRTQPEDMSVTGVSGDCSPPVPDSRRKADSHTSKRKPGSNASSSCSSSATTNKATLPLNLISATNQQKVQAQSVQVKQQLPYKLATKLGGSSSGTGNSNSSSSSSSSVVQQILPYKLSQGQSPTSSVTESTSGRRGSGYRRLGSGSFSPPSRTAAADETAAPSPHSHVRTGSSPASMQSELPSPPPVESGMSRRSAGGLDRTHNHPVNRVGSPGPESAPQSASSRRSADEEVIYF